MRRYTYTRVSYKSGFWFVMRGWGLNARMMARCRSQGEALGVLVGLVSR